MPQIKSLLGATRVKFDGLELVWEQGSVTVRFANGRSQLLRYAVEGDFLRFTSTVLKPAAARELGLDRLAEELLERNRDTPVVAFGVSRSAHVEAWIEQRTATLQPDELRFYLAALATEADRLEYLLTGRDVH